MYRLDFMIFPQVTKKVFIVFSPEEISLDTNTFSVSKSFKKLALLLLFVSYCSTFFGQIDIFYQVYGLAFANSANSAAIIGNFNA